LYPYDFIFFCRGLIYHACGLSGLTLMLLPNSIPMRVKGAAPLTLILSHRGARKKQSPSLAKGEAFYA